jgi:hypothetical protein
MKTETKYKHNQTPWKIVNDEIVDMNGKTILNDGSAAGEYDVELDMEGPNAAFIILAVNSYEKLIDIAEDMADFDCFQPWGTICENCTGGEKPCEPCRARAILAEGK